MTESNGLQTLGSNGSAADDEANQPSNTNDPTVVTDETANEDRTGSTTVDTAENDVKTIVPPVNQAFQQSVLDAEAEKVNDATGEARLKEQDFTIVQHLDPARQADPHGVYLDDVQRAQAETIRARVENREPDYEHPGTTASDVVMPTEAARTNALPGAEVPVAFSQEIMIGSEAKSDEDDVDEYEDAEVR